jgi:hypothetical protein
MKLQDKHKYDSTVVGLENLYVVDSDGNFFINSPAIMTPDKTVIRNNSYLLIKCSYDEKRKIYPVSLIDAYYKDCRVYLFVQDLLTQRIFCIDIVMDDSVNKWLLVDMTCLSELWDYLIIKSYCGNCK